MVKIYKALIICLVFLSFEMSAQISLDFESRGTVTQGGTIEIDVSVSDFEEIVLMQYSINWDRTVLRYNSIINVTDVLPQFSFNDQDGGNLGVPPIAPAVDPGEMTVSWSLNSTNPVTIPDDTRLFTIVMDVIGEPCRNSIFTLANQPSEIEVVIEDANGDFVEIGATAESINIEIPGTNCGSSDQVALVGSKETVDNGGNVCMNITTQNFTNVSGLQFGVKFDPSVLTLTSNSSDQLSGYSLTQRMAGGSAIPGEYLFVWTFPLTGSPVTLADDSSVLEMCFDVNGNPGTGYNVDITEFNNFEIVISDADVNPLPFFVERGTITINSGGGGMNGVGIIGSMETAASGSQACMSITTTDDFVQIEGLQFGISFDSNILSVASSSSDALNQFSLVPRNGFPGQYNFFWTLPISDSPVTLPEGGEIVEICFDVSGNVGQMSSVDFQDNGTFVIEITDTNDNSLPFFTQSGKVTITDGNQPTDVTLIAEELTAEAGSSVCVDLSVRNFTDVQSSQFAIQWDPTILRYDSIGCVNIPQFGAPNANQDGNDKLNVSWAPSTPSTLADDHVLFCVCYTVITDCTNAGTSPVNFVSNGNFEIEFSNSDDQVIPVIVDQGSVTVNSCSPSINIVQVTEPECNGESSGSVIVNVTGGMGNENCSWTRNGSPVGTAGSCNLTGVPAGTYLLTVTEGGFSTNRSVTIGEPSIISLSADVSSGCSGAAGIDLTASGGVGNYRYSWDGGIPANTEDPSNLSVGTYCVTVSDGNDCTATGCYEVTDSSQDLQISTESIVNGSCGTSASIDISVSGGCGSYRYNWQGPNGAQLTTQDIMNIANGNWTVVVTDNNGTTATQSFTISSEVEDMEITLDNLDNIITCGTNSLGAISVSVSGGCPSYTYFWNGPAGFSSSTQDISNLSVAGEYVLNVAGSGSNQSATRTFTIREGSFILDIKTECATEGEADGVASLTIDGGTAPYQITWSRGTVSADDLSVFDLGTGPLSVIVVDANGCEAAMQNIQIEACTVVNELDCSNARSVITPNNDGVNDVFIIECIDEISGSPNTLSVYDRWGRLMYSADSYNNDWDGKDNNGIDLLDGGYMWVLEVTFEGGNRVIYRGALSILRSL